MSVYLLTFLHSHLYSKPSGCKLADLAGFTSINNFRGINRDNDDILIRYGIVSYPSKDIWFKYVINKSDDIKRSMNKLISSRYMFIHGIKTPEIWIERNRITQEDLPVLSRLVHHSRGKDIILIDTINKLIRTRGDYFVKFIKNKSEYRLHVIGNNPVRLQKKISVSEEEHYIHNVDHGYVLKDHYKHDIDIENEVIEEGLRVIELLNLDFGAIDILVSVDNKIYILEVNSAPRLNRFGRSLYAYHLNRLIGNKVSIKDFSRLRFNEGTYSFNLPIEVRDIVKKEDKSFYY